MNILVTGGAGYIGSHTVLKLIEQGHFVVVYDNLINGNKECIFSDEFVKGDVNDILLLKETIKKFKINLVMHFASLIDTSDSMINPSDYFVNNSMASLSLLNVVVEMKVKYFIFSSSASVYGCPNDVPIKEDCPYSSVSPYGESKIITEKILKWYSKIYDFHYISLRYFNVSGSDAKLRTGEMHNPETHLIPLAIQTAFKKRKSLNIYGNDYNTKDGTAIRDYVHVDDLADAHILSMEYLYRENKSNVFNLGSEKGFSVNEVVNMVKKLTDRDINILKSNRRHGDPDILVASSKKAKNILKWQPVSTNLDKIIESSINFYKKNNHIR